MKRILESYLLQQMIHPLPAEFVDVDKTAGVRRGFEYNGKRYLGSEDLVEVTHDKKQMRGTRGQLQLECDQVIAPSSFVKEWWCKGWVAVTGLSFETGTYDCYNVGDPSVRGYRPWLQPDRTDQYSGQLPQSEFDDLWLPISFLKRGEWTPAVYFPYALYQRAPIFGQQSGHDTVVINLGATLDAMHRRMVSGAY